MKSGDPSFAPHLTPQEPWIQHPLPCAEMNSALGGQRGWDDPSWHGNCSHNPQ